MESFYIKVQDPSSIDKLVAKYSLNAVRYPFMPNVFTVDGSGTEFLTLMNVVSKDALCSYIQTDHLNIATCQIGEPVPYLDNTGRAPIGANSIVHAWALEYSTRRPKIMPVDQSLINQVYPGNDYSPSFTGAGVDVFLLDSGILYTHEQLIGAQPLPGYTDPYANNGVDGFGHGTHVAGIIAGKNTGVAPDVRLYSVRVFDNAGVGASAAQYTAAFNAILAFASTSGRRAVVNMSLAASPTEAYPYIFEENPNVYDDYLDDGVKALWAAGIVVCVAAGNGFASTISTTMGMNAKYIRPARVPTVLTVGAVGIDSNKMVFSNYGQLVDVYAPGSSLVSSYLDLVGAPANATYVYLSGTSMACPIVTGICALLLEQHPQYTPDQIASLLINSACNNEIRNLAVANTPANDGALSLGTQLYSYDSINPAFMPLVYEPGAVTNNRIATIRSVNSSSVLHDGSN
jgi:subtilisin family serine protease